MCKFQVTFATSISICYQLEKGCELLTIAINQRMNNSKVDSNLNSTRSIQTSRRIVKPGTFSNLIHQSYDDSKSSNNSNLTVFRILNPSCDPNTPKIAPMEHANKSKKFAMTSSNDSTSTTSTHSHMTNKLTSDRKRPTSGYIPNRTKQTVESPHVVDPYGEPIPTGRKCLVELEEELIAKSIQLQKLTQEYESVSVCNLYLTLHITI